VAAGGSQPWRVAILGVGLIGGSLGLALRARAAASRVVGVGRSEAALRRALELGAVDEVATDLARGVAGADVVVLAAPVRACIALLPAVAAAVGPGAVITDVASTKAAIVAAAPAGAAFVGGHPMAGSERTGVEAASARLFEDATWVVTPTATTPAWALERVLAMAAAAGARPVVMDAGTHDRRVAAVSHLPQAVAVALAAAVPAEALPLAARGFRDTTRLAASSPAVWNDIFATNRDNVVAAIAACEDRLAELRAAIAAGDEAAVEALFARAAAATGGAAAEGRGRAPAAGGG
jgi:prephenate dehydrogenase